MLACSITLACKFRLCFIIWNGDDYIWRVKCIHRNQTFWQPDILLHWSHTVVGQLKCVATWGGSCQLAGNTSMSALETLRWRGALSQALLTPMSVQVCSKSWRVMSVCVAIPYFKNYTKVNRIVWESSNKVCLEPKGLYSGMSMCLEVLILSTVTTGGILFYNVQLFSENLFLHYTL